MADKPFTSAIVFASDQGYIFLARGLVLSLNAAGFPNADAQARSWSISAATTMRAPG